MSSAADRYKWTALGTTTMGMLVATMSLVVALASSLRGGRYVHEEHAGADAGAGQRGSTASTSEPAASASDAAAVAHTRPASSVPAWRSAVR